MAKVIGQVESLKTLRDELNKRNISRFNSIGDINRFNKGFANEKQNILKSHKNRINEEIEEISSRIVEIENQLELKKEDEKTKLNSSIENYIERKNSLEQRRNTFIGKVTVHFKLRRLKRKIAYLKENYDQIIDDSVRSIRKEIYDTTRRLK